MTPIKVKKLRPGAVLPTYGSAGAAGADLYACLDAPLTLAPGEAAWVPTGLAMEIPEGYVGLVCARSGLACRRGVAPANKVGVIDSDYRGECTVVLRNESGEPQILAPGERIAQMLLVPVATPGFQEAERLSDTGRGSGGFGSTGR